MEPTTEHLYTQCTSSHRFVCYQIIILRDHGLSIPGFILKRFDHAYKYRRKSVKEYFPVVYNTILYTGFVRGVCIGGSTADKLITVGDDKTVKIWRDPSVSVTLHEPIAAIITSQVLMGCDHSYEESCFATCGTGQVDVWDEERAEPVSTFRWDTPSDSFSDSINSVKYNPVETCVLASTGSDRYFYLCQ